jgi:crotonobetainyl-CoA:carnitine CoA-transferase CaiB-like acyl-CoA transferase
MVVKGAPQYGEDTREVLAEAGIDPAEIDSLCADAKLQAAE